jgi:serine/threonine protein phosphatase PrpC
MAFRPSFMSRVNSLRRTIAESRPRPALEIATAIVTDRGSVRPVNQDFAAVFIPADFSLAASRGLVAVVADGMGGANGGEIASALTGQQISSSYFTLKGLPSQVLRSSLEAANAAIFERATSDPHLRGMGTTCVALAIAGHQAWTAWVGDSRIYLIRRGAIHRLSSDHSLVNDWVHRGWLTPAEARSHPDRNVLSRALGTKEKIEVSMSENPVQVWPGDKFLLCTDGLYDLVSEDELLAYCQPPDVSSCANTLVHIAKERGGHDNISVVIVEAVDRGSFGSTTKITREYCHQ